MVDVRPPRFLGEKVPQRDYNTQELISYNLGSDYIVESQNGGYIAKKKPVEYLAERQKKSSGNVDRYESYTPHILYIDSEGNVLRETKRGIYKSYQGKRGKTYAVYDYEKTDYQNQTKYIYDTREKSSGADRVYLAKRVRDGIAREKKVYDYGTPGYDEQRRTELQRKLIREKGFKVMKTKEYEIAGKSEAERDAYYKAVALQKQKVISDEARRQRIERNLNKEFQKEYKAEHKKYAQDITDKVNAEREKKRFAQSIEPPKPENLRIPAGSIKPIPGTTRTDMGKTGPLYSIEPIPPPNTKDLKIPEGSIKPIPGTTRTDMGDSNVYFKQKLPKSEVQYIEKPSLRKDPLAYINRLQDTISFKTSRARAKGETLKAYSLSASEYVVGVPVGAGKLVYSVVPPIVSASAYALLNLEVPSFKFSGDGPDKVVNAFLPPVIQGTPQLFQRESYYNLGQELRTRTPKTAGEITGRVVTGYGLAKLTKYGVYKYRQRQLARRQTGPSNIGKVEQTQKQLDQYRLPQKGKQYDPSEIKIPKEGMRFAKQKTGKAPFENTVFTSKKVIDSKGRVVKTPAIVKVRDEIPGNPSRLGTTYGKDIILSKDVQSTLIKPKIIARSKWLPGDVRVVYVTPKKQVYIKSLFDDRLIPYNPQEFKLETIYPNRPLSYELQTAISNAKLPPKEFMTSHGKVTIKGVGAETQSKLPTSKTYVDVTGVTPSKLKPPKVDVPKPEVVSSSTFKPTDSVGTQATQLVQVEKYAPATKVIEGSLKVVPKYKLVEQTQPVSVPVQKVELSQVPTASIIGGGSLSNLIRPTSSSSIKPAQNLNFQSTPKDKPSQSLQPLQVPSVATDPRQSIKVSQVQRLEPKSIDIVRTRQSGVFDVITRNEQVLDVYELTQQVQTPGPQTNTFIGGAGEPVPETPPVIPKPKLPFEDEFKSKSKFSVEVREKGIFKRVASGLNLDDAFKTGKQKVLSTSSASFKVLTSSGDVVQDFDLNSKFYKSKKEPGVFIQKKETRISSPGEKRDITSKGLLKIRNKNKKLFGGRTKWAF